MKFIIRSFFCLAILIQISGNASLFGQSDKALSIRYAQNAVEQRNRGNTDLALMYLDTARTLNPNDIRIEYEIGYVYFLRQDYKRSIRTYQTILNHPQVHHKVYWMLGNSWYMLGNESEAMSVYGKGVKLFPESALIYYEMGNIKLAGEDIRSALIYYEKGITSDPEFASNYFQAARIYLSSEEMVWGMVYGEMFMNIERNTKRTAEMSSLLYKSYVKGIRVSLNSPPQANFSITKIDTSNPDTTVLPFGGGVYEPIIAESSNHITIIDINSLNTIRTNFVRIYFEKGYSNLYPLGIFDFQKQLLDSNHIEAYNYWLLRMGEKDAFDIWLKSNPLKWERFVKWFMKNEYPFATEEKK